MDILYWINLNHKIKIYNTKKMYFSQYVYRLEIFCPGGRFIYENQRSIRDLIKQNQTVGLPLYQIRNYKNFNWYSDQSKKSIHDAVESQLETVKKLLLSPSIKIRVEEPKVQVYAEGEQNLKDFIERFSPQDRARIVSITVPKDSKSEALLKENKIIRGSRRNLYRYKVSLRDCRVDPNTKINLLNYLDSLEDSVLVPQGPRKMMSAPFSSFWGVYFYTNDLSINTFIELIKPGVISNINEIVVAE